jgi:hypothetical protein
MGNSTVRPSSWLCLLLGFLFISFLLVNKGDVFSVGSDIEDYVKVIPWWFLGTWSLYLLVKFVFKKKLSAKTIMLYWSAAGVCALFHWAMIKFDPYPYNGPIDKIVKRDVIERMRVQDSLTRMNGSPDSTIEYVHSIDTAEEGVYIWLHGKEVFLRKFGEGGYAWRSDLDREAIRQLNDTLQQH